MVTNVNSKQGAKAKQRSRSLTGRGLVEVPLRFRSDPVVWAAWLYFHDGMTQNEVAEVMGVSRATVNAYVAEARARDVVTVRMDPGWLSSVTLARRLSETYGLNDAVVIPDAGAAGLAERLGAATAELLTKLLQPGDVLGVAWGRTIMSLAQGVATESRARIKDLSVAQIIGGTTGTVELSPEVCASMLAERLGARCIYLTAPAIVSSKEVRRILLQEPILRDQFSILRTVNKVVFGIGSTDADSLIYESGLIDPAATPSAKGVPAAAVIACRFVTAEGKPIEDDYDERVIGLSLSEIADIGLRLAVAGGLDKVGAIRACLLGGYANVLVTDAATAEALVQD